MQASENKDYQHLDWHEILKHIQGFATSGTAKLRLNSLGPKANAEAALIHLQNIFDAAQILAQGSRPFMESLDLFEPWYGRLKRQAVLKTLEIKDVRSFCLEVVALEEVLKIQVTGWGRQLLDRLMKASEPLSAIDQIITPRGEIRSDASETLYRLYREKENLARQVQASLDKLVKDHDMQNYLQDRYVTTSAASFTARAKPSRRSLWNRKKSFPIIIGFAKLKWKSKMKSSAC
jgi:DNA mismatch repair protein MutS2